MSAIIFDGKKVAAEIRLEVKSEIEELVKERGRAPGLAVILVGNDPASELYVNNKKKACKEVGINSFVHKLTAGIEERKVIALIDELNEREDVDGILVQLPLPQDINEARAIMRVRPEKDVDGFHPLNLGRLFAGVPNFVACTPLGAMELLKRYRIQIEGKNCVVVGRSIIVGRPIVSLLLAENGTVTICHSRSANLSEICRRADILVAALGKPRFITADMVKPGAVVVDVGTNRLPDGKFAGDVDFLPVAEEAGAVTPVPGGIGPMTIAMLMKNCLKAFKDKVEN